MEREWEGESKIVRVAESHGSRWREERRVRETVTERWR